MQDSLHLQYQRMDPPILLARMGITNEERPTLLNRLEMLDDTPQNLQTMDSMEPVLLGRLGMMSEEVLTTENQTRLKKNVSSKWTTSSRASDRMKSPNSKHSQPSYQSSTSTHLGLRERKTQPWNVTQKHLTRFKPCLLQRLGEVESPKGHWDQREEPQTERNLLDPLTMMPKSTNSSLKSVETQKDPRFSLLTAIPTMNSTSMELPPTKNGEFSNPRCLGIPGKKKPDEAATKIAKNHGKFSTSSLETTKSSNGGSKILEPHPSDSLDLSGTISSEDKLSTSTQCSPHCTTFQLLRRTLDTWDTLRSPSEDLNLQRRFK
jgi:hypothetical protein